MPLSTSPRSDADRLRALRRLRFLEATPAEPFDRLAGLAARTLDAAGGFISLVGEECDLLLGVAGLAESAGSDRRVDGETFCEHLILSGEPLVVTDVAAHPVFGALPLRGRLGIGSYLGVPVRMEDGTLVGGCCVIDRAARAWGVEEVEALESVAAAVSAELEVRAVRRELARAKGALESAEARYEELVHDLDAIVWEMELPSWRFTFVNRTAERILGYPRESWFRADFWQETVLHPEDRDRAVRFCMAATAAGRDHEFEYRAIAADGRVVWLTDRVRVVVDEAGKPRLLRGVMIDVSESHRVRAELQVAEAHYRRLVENAPYAVYMLDDAGRFTEVNPAACELLGYEAGELIGRSAVDITHPGDRPVVRDAIARKLAGEARITDFETRLVQKSGREVLLHVRSAAIEENGRVVGTHGIARDITGERARQEQMQLLYAALESLDQGVSIARFDGQIIYANAAHGRLLGFDPGAAPLPKAQSFAPDAAARAELEEILRITEEQGRWLGRLQRRRLDDGALVPVELILRRVDRGGGPGLFFAIARDVSAELEQEQRLRRAERLASLGTLVGGVAHELNNPLHAITNFAQLLLMDPRPAEEHEDLEVILREAQRMAKIVSDLQLIARRTQQDRPVRERVDLNALVCYVLQTRRYAIETRNITVESDLAPDLPDVLGDPGELEQVIINLVVNAEQAMAGNEGERRLTVRTRAGARGLHLHVEDTGSGIPARLLERIFDPFFTTKDPGEGTGLGLSLVHSIVTEHGGQIGVESRPGAGAAFAVELPAASETALPPATPADEAPAERVLRVLVVDDEEPVRRSIVRYLQRRGHRVGEAREGREALAEIERGLGEGAPYEVILTDLRMPGLGGDALLNRLRERGDGAERVIFLTGDAASPEAAHLIARTGAPVLIKPASLTEIARAVEARAGGEHTR